MDNIFINFLHYKFNQYNIKDILIINDVLSVEEIMYLSRKTIKTIFIGIDNLFLRQKYLLQLKNVNNVIIEELNFSINNKFRRYDAILSSNINEYNIILLPKVYFYFSRSLLVNSVFSNYTKDTELLLVSNEYLNSLKNNDIYNNDNDNDNDNDDNNIDKKFVSFFIVNYNTSKLINLLIRSIHKNIKSFNYNIWIFDNSDSEQLILDEEWNDVNILDNSKNELIDYNIELKKYTNEKNYKKFKGFISLKHALAIQYGYDHDEISENMIICDSDILLYKDIDFINDEKFSIGMPEKKNGDKTRFCPYLCYINKKLCKDKNIKYFDENRMHGCGGIDDKKVCLAYDTGTSFFEDLQNYETLFIDIFNYCIHFGSGSRSDSSARKNNFDINEICEKINLFNDKECNFTKSDFEKYYINKFDIVSFTENDFSNKIYELIENEFQIEKSEKKYVIYTCITGNYDSINDNNKFDFNNFDYYCFTDSKNLKSSKWKIIDISKIKDYLKLNDETKLARFIKTHPHLFFKKYEKSIWIDANIDILSNNLIENYVNLLCNDNYIIIPEHPCINDVYDEAIKCEKLKKDTKENINKIVNFLKNENFVSNKHHVQSGIILRNHNDERCKFLMEQWWQMIFKFSKRDQLSFNYVFWKFNGKYISISWKLISSILFNTNYKHLNK